MIGVRKFGTRHCDEDVNHGQLYPTLDDLVSAGYVEKGQIDDRTNAYSLTDEGRELIEERLEWENQYVDL